MSLLLAMMTKLHTRFGVKPFSSLAIARLILVGDHMNDPYVKIEAKLNI
jgi:hypothetical protein